VKSEVVELASEVEGFFKEACLETCGSPVAHKQVLEGRNECHMQL
jgi:hypothetical protein